MQSLPVRILPAALPGKGREPRAEEVEVYLTLGTHPKPYSPRCPKAWLPPTPFTVCKTPRTGAFSEAAAARRRHARPNGVGRAAGAACLWVLNPPVLVRCWARCFSSVLLARRAQTSPTWGLRCGWGSRRGLPCPSTRQQRFLRALTRVCGLRCRGLWAPPQK